MRDRVMVAGKYFLRGMCRGGGGCYGGGEGRGGGGGGRTLSTETHH